MLRSTKTQIDRRFRATGRDQTQARSCRPRPVVGGRKSTLTSACVERQLVATGHKSRTCTTLSNLTPSRRRLVAVRRQSSHVASDPATDQLPFNARPIMSPAILRPIGRNQSQPVADNQSSTSCRPILKPT